jgi:hypothetical protein
MRAAARPGIRVQQGEGNVAIAAAVPEKHSGPGIASFIISLVASMAMFVLIGIAGVLEVSTPGGMDEDSPAAVLIGLCMFLLLGLELLAAGLGVAGVLQQARRRVFAVLGLVISTGTMLFTLFLMMVGLMA